MLPAKIMMAIKYITSY